MSWDKRTDRLRTNTEDDRGERKKEINSEHHENTIKNMMCNIYKTRTNREETRKKNTETVGILKTEY